MNDTKPVEMSEWQAPFLTGLDLLPDCPELVDHVASYRDYKHNAKTASKDQAKTYEVLTRRLHGQGKKKIAAAVGVSKWTVQAIWDKAEAEGILAPLKQQLSKKAGEILADGLDDLHDRVLNRELPANVLPIALGVVADKKAAWDGQAGLIIEHRGPMLNWEAVNQVWASPSPGSTPESSSGANGAIAAGKQGQLGVGSGAGAGMPSASLPVIEAELVADPSPAAVAGEGGGGSENSRPAANPDGSPSGENFAKGSPSEPAPL